MTEQVMQTANGITNYGILVMISSIYLVLTAAMMIAIFRWFKSIINQILKQNKEMLAKIASETKGLASMIHDVSEQARDDSKMRAKTVISLYIENAITKVCRMIKRVREENNISDRDMTHNKVLQRTQVLYKQMESDLYTFSYRGKKISESMDERWVDEVVSVVEQELYNPAGVNNSRAYANVSTVFTKIRTELEDNLE